MWTFLLNLVAIIASAFRLWHEEKLRNEGRQDAVKKAEDDAKATEAVAADASANPAVIERVRSRFDRARRNTPPAS
jgi:hypothetical protein